METTIYLLEIGFGIFSIVIGAIIWAVNIKINHAIQTNEKKLDKEIQAIKDESNKHMEVLSARFTKELNDIKEKFNYKLGELDKEISTGNSELNDKILTTVNGKYVRSDLLQTYQKIIEISIQKLEQSLERQITDLKERIFQRN